MTAAQSFLSNTKYGYDFVVATTQASINATMKQFLAKVREPVVNICFVANEAGQPVQIAYAALKDRAKGADPFKVPADANPTTNTDLQNLQLARFMAGFRAQLGIPKGYRRPTDIPDLVILGSDTAAVTFNMLCVEFDIVELVPGGGYNAPTWTSLSQKDGEAWIIQSKVDLRMSLVNSDQYSQLPPDVRAKIQNLGGDTFSVRQLLFDFTNAGLAAQVPTIPGINPGTKLYQLLTQYFMGAYFTQLQKDGQPMLGAAITQSTAPPSTLTLTNLNMEVCPFVGTNGLPVAHPSTDQQRLATLSYLCEANGHLLPPAVAFNWNWIDPSEAADSHGVIATNKTPFVTFFKNELLDYVEQNCFAPSVKVWYDSGEGKTYFQPNLERGQAPTITAADTGATVLSFSYSSYAADQADLGGDMGRAELKPEFNLDVKFAGTTITIEQHLLIYLYLKGYWGVNKSGNIIDKKIADTYTLSVTSQGGLTATLTTTSSDNSVRLATSGWEDFWGGGLQSVIDAVSEWARAFTSPSFKDIPINVVQDFVFPGGRTFAFKNVAFSDNQDLVSHITYADPAYF
jgi:hypothetical protein